MIEAEAVAIRSSFKLTLQGHGNDAQVETRNCVNGMPLGGKREQRENADEETGFTNGC